jgi:hypothetical protein
MKESLVIGEGGPGVACESCATRFRRHGGDQLACPTAARTYWFGPSRDWLKVKNPDSPAMIRAREVDWEAHEKARRWGRA